MSTNPLLSLADRIEQASGPDRELDTDVFEAVDPKRFQRHFWDLRASQSKGDPDAEAKARSRMRGPAYTASLDAAMTLLPPDTADCAWFWQVGHDGEGEDPAAFRARMLGAVAFSRQIETTAVADTAALALTAAALRARAAK